MIRELFSARVYQGEFPLDDVTRESMRRCALESHARYNLDGMPWSRNGVSNILTAPESGDIFLAFSVANPGPMLIDVRIARSVVTLPYRRIHYGLDE